jgi:hypothetical protein
LKNQLSFNKMMETQITQIATAIPVDNTGKTRGNSRIPPSLSMQLQNNVGGEVLPDGLKMQSPCQR